MKIAIPIDRLDPGRGGLERYVADLARALSARGHEVHVPCLSGSLPEGGIQVHHLAVSPGPRPLGRFARACESWLGERRVDVSLGVGRSLGTDIYQAHGGVHRTSRAALRAAERSLVRAGARRIADALRRKDRFLEALERDQILHPATRSVVALSGEGRRDLLGAYPEVEGRTTVIPIGVDLGRFSQGDRKAHRADLRRRWGIPDGRCIALFVGHHFLLKGLGPALEALGRIPASARPHLVVIGRGRAAAFRRGAVRLGLERGVTFAGALPGVEGSLLGSDLLIQPTFHDPCSHVTLEAWAAGVPVVTTARNGAAELAQGGAAVAVVEDPWDVDGLRRGIEEMLTPGKWPERSAEARRVAETRSLDRHVGEMEDLFREVTRREVREGAGAG